MKQIVSADMVAKRIYIIRGVKVMLSPDLAELYDAAPKVLVQSVKRNRERFPEDFMFQLKKAEYENLKFQFGISNLKSQSVTSSWGGVRRAMPYACTEQGVAMLSSVLRSKRAARVNVEIMRAFVKLRETLALHKDLARKLEALEKRVGDQDAKIKAVFDAIRELMKEPEKPAKRIGFTAEESRAKYRV
jgi:hypothetical protein